MASITNRGSVSGPSIDDGDGSSPPSSLPLASNPPVPVAIHSATSPPVPSSLAHVVGRHGGSSRQHHGPYHHQHQQTNPIVESMQSTLDSIRQHLETHKMLPNANGSALPIFISGTLAFYATAFSSQLIQHKLLKMSTGTRPAILPSALGFATVATGSWMGHLAGLGTMSAWDKVQDAWRESRLLQRAPNISRAALSSVEEMVRPMRAFVVEDLSRDEKRERREAWMHAARICVLGLLTYKVALRSNFSSISPSSYTARGSFARVGIPAPPNFNYATRSQRLKIERLGRLWGCHTCGSRMILSNLVKNVPKFHGDHIPPVSVAKQLNERWYRKMFGVKVSQKFYPQCRDCSNKQGGLLAKAISNGHRNLRAVGGGEESYFHGRRMRIGHLAGGAVAVASVSNEGKLVDSSRERLHSLQHKIEDLGRDLIRQAKGLWNNVR